MGIQRNKFFGVKMTRRKKVYVVTSGDGSTHLQISTDGITWTRSTLPTFTSWRDVQYANNVFVVVSHSSSTPQTAAISTDAIVWTQTTLPTNSGLGWHLAVSAGNVSGTFMFNALIRDNSIGATSTDGITWTQISVLPNAGSPSAYWTSIVGGTKNVDYPGGGTVAVAHNSQTAALFTNSNSWTQKTLPIVSSWSKVMWGQPGFIAISDSGTQQIAAISTDGTTWTRKTLPRAEGFSYGAYGNGKYVIFPTNSATFCLSSTDGTTWTQSYTGSIGCKDVIFADNKFTAISASGSTKFKVSSNGIDWTTVQGPPDNGSNARMAYGEQPEKTELYDLGPLAKSLIEDTYLS
jgi:hypothetical protein